jgi:uncharacterized protein (TIGR00369 family)
MNQQPNSRTCFACGMENEAGLRLRFFDDGSTEVVADFTLASDHEGYPGIAHGGIVAAILDEVAGRTMMIGDHQRFFITAKMEIRYRQPVPIGRPLQAVGRMTRQRGRLTFAHAEIHSPGRAVLAEADLLFACLPQAILDPREAAEKFGWRLYDHQGEPAA